MSVHRIEDYKDQNGEWRWRITVPQGEGNIVADSGEGYKNKADMLNSLFNLFFGAYDESFLDLYAEWNPEGDPGNLLAEERPDHPPVEAQAGAAPWGDSDQAL